VFFTALAATFLMTPPVVRFALRHGIVDKPGERRVNVRIVARFGGPAMFFGFVAACFVAWPYVDGMLWILLGASIIVATGVIDDVRTLSAGVKLVGQVGAAVLMFATGSRLEFITNPLGGYFYFPLWLSFLFTVFWIVGVTNTLNLIDGLDGLAAGITCIASLTFLLVSVQKGQIESALLAALMAGVTAGFLRWNFYPAKTFMGDSGALFLGFMVSVIALKGAFKSTTVLSFLVPVLALGVPIFDTSFAIVRRVKARQPVMTAPDKGHLHHRLLAAGWRHRDAVLLMYIITLALSVAALLIIRAWWLALYLVAGIIVLTGLLIALGKIKPSKGKSHG
jgi:UDP-GlcNAc:undecaprenyl-phosphate GlcNAc-1-phosphate transferase